MIVGTAGHIDHGKTSLVRALTGIDTDRLKEEKARGITIELGFAYWPRPDGRIVGFVDVPGHERLVHTMLAGASGIDFVMLAIAADDGVMPQTREHLAIVDLLGLRHGLVVMTKADLADATRRAEVEAQIRAALSDTGLAGADIVAVSAATGEGMGDLASRLDRASASLAARSNEGRFRLGIDRVFSLPGAGTVVTGTIVSGSIGVGDQVMVSPAGLEARVRSIHAQNRPVERGQAGERCAIALVGPRIGKDTVPRGDMLLDPLLHAPARRIDAQVSLLPSEKKALGQWVPVRVHHGAAEIAARLVVLDEKGIGPGERGFAQLVLDAPLAAAAGDRFVLRDTAATRTIGGGRIVDLRAPDRKRRTPERIAELAALARPDPMEALKAVLDSPRRWVELESFFRDRAASPDLPQRATDQLGLTVFRAGNSMAVMLPASWATFRAELLGLLEAFHHDKPDLPGLGAEQVRLRLKPRLPAPVFDAVLQTLRRAGEVVLDRAWVRLPGHEVRFTDEEERLWSRVRPLLADEVRFRPPRVRDIARALDCDERVLRRLFKMAARRGEVDEVAQDHFFLSGTMVEMADIARDLGAGSAEGAFTVIAFRDRLDSGRKVAIQILEFFDRQGLTMRRGDIRRINPHKAKLFSASSLEEAPQDGGVSSPVGRPDFKSGEGCETVLGRFDSYLLRQNPRVSDGDSA